MNDPLELEPGMFALDPDDDRTVRGMLLPYGVASGQPMAGEAGTMFAAGDVEIPADPSIVTLNRQHNRFDPVGRGVELEETAGGVLAALRFANTPEGDAELADYRAGKRKPLSAEIATYRDRAGAIVRRVLVGAGIVDRGAFAGAHLFAADEPEPAGEPAGEELPPAVLAALETIAAEYGVPADELTLTIPKPSTPAPGHAGVEPNDEPAAHAAGPTDEPPAAADDNAHREETAMPEATAPATIATGTGTGADEPQLGTGDLFAAIVNARENGTPIPAEFAAGAELFALGGATGNLGTVMEPQFIGEVWSGGDYVPKWMGLFAPASLTSLVVNGWRFVTRPTVEPYAGDGAPVGGTAVTTEPVTEAAQRFAGGNVIPREYYDFNARQFVEAWSKYSRDDWARKADGYVRTKALAAAVLLDSNVPAGGEPSLPVIRRIVDGVFELAKDPVNARATFAMIPTEDYKLLMHTGHSDLLEYLSLALGVEKGSALGFHLGWDDALPAGDVIVGARQAATVRTLPGSPIRINAANVAAGSFDEALFGYVHFLDECPDALLRVRDIA
jgi:hypothetical protein